MVKVHDVVVVVEGRTTSCIAEVIEKEPDVPFKKPDIPRSSLLKQHCGHLGIFRTGNENAAGFRGSQRHKHMDIGISVNADEFACNNRRTARSMILQLSEDHAGGK